MLDCCVSLDVVKRDGVTFDQFVCLADCNGCSVDLVERVDLSSQPSSAFLLPPAGMDDSSSSNAGALLESKCRLKALNCCSQRASKPESQQVQQTADLMKGQQDKLRNDDDGRTEGIAANASSLSSSESYFKQHVDKVGYCFA